MKNKLLAAMQDYFGRDERRIDHARRVFQFAEQIMLAEPGDREIVEAAAILHDIGIHAAEKKYGSTAGRYQEIEGPPIAAQILERLAYPAEKIPAILAIIGHHHSPGKINTHDFKILYDADRLVNLGDEYDLSDKEKLHKLIDRIFLTKAGKELAAQLYL